MPHKHRRKEVDKTQFDLPPSIKAKPLPVHRNRTEPSSRPKNKRKQPSSNDYGADDTPKAFARLMQFGATGKGRKGLDDGPQPKKKKQKTQASDTAADVVDSESQIPLPITNSEGDVKEKLEIRPGEKLSDFRQRVAAALPLTGLSKKGKKVDGLKDHRVTKHEKKLKRLQEGWRKEEARIREKEEEQKELAEEEQDEIDAMWEDKTMDLPVGKKGKKGKRRKVVGEVDGDEDEWEALRKKREQRKGLHDVVQEPPTFTRIPKEKFKVKNGAKVLVADIPNAVGSLRKREELGEERQTIIDTYRRLMEAKRN